MPRRPRSDEPGAVHHVFVRGIERRDLFLGDVDRHAHLELLSRVIPEAGTRCFGWALQVNHVHLVLKTGRTPLAAVMHRIGTTYAVYFNLRYGREGYVFQGRYGARRVEEEADLVALLRYVHRNPLEAGAVSSLAALERYPWTGYGAMLGVMPAWGFHSVAEALLLFGHPPALARRELRRRMLDTSMPPARSSPEALDTLIRSVCGEIGADERAVRDGRRTRREAAARTEIVRRARAELGLRTSVVAARLGVSRQALWERIDSSRARGGRKLDKHARPLLDGPLLDGPSSRAGRGGRRG